MPETGTESVNSIVLKNVSKYFPVNGVQALADAGMELRAGEVHALLGENGAGKSTLMHVLAGALEPTAGTILIDGAERRFRSCADALGAGIGMVRQHPVLVPGFALWEDCVLGAEPLRYGILDARKARERTSELSSRWSFDLDVDARTEDLAVSQRQKAAVLALLLRGVRCLVLDEPTAVLAPRETERLFDLLRRLRHDGRTIVLISHKLEETLSIADRVTVIRRGRTVATMGAAEARPDEVAALMFGSVTKLVADPFDSAGSGVPKEKATRYDADHKLRDTILKVRGLEVRARGRPHVRGVDLDVVQGQVAAIAGVRESGLETLELAIAGLLECAEGSVEVNGVRVENRGPRAFREAGAAYASADRTQIATAPELSILDNLSAHVVSRARVGLAGSFGLLDARFLRSWATGIMKDAEVDADPRTSAGSLSGGTLQRLALARELAENPELLVLSEPGWGLDARHRARMRKRVLDLARGGKAVLLFSTDIDELLALADSVAVLRDGTVAARFDLRGGQPGSSFRESIGEAMIGAEAYNEA